MTELFVSKDSPRDAASLGEALARAEGLSPGAVTIRLGPGDFREKIRITRPDTRIVGAGPGLTRILWDDSAPRHLPDGEAMGTFNSATVYIGAAGVRLHGLALVNEAGKGRLAGQAVALYADADDLLVEDCRLEGWQDTLCTGPLPRNPLPKGINLLHPVAGLPGFDPVLPFRQLYRSCLILGSVDFIFGSALACFDRCRILSRAEDPQGTPFALRGKGWIAAPSTWPGEARGFVFWRCEFEAEEGTGPVFLARPWRVTGKTVYVDCRLGAHIAAEGWEDWGKSEVQELGGFGESGSWGPGADSTKRVPWARRLGAAEASSLDPRLLFGDLFDNAGG